MCGDRKKEVCIQWVREAEHSAENALIRSCQRGDKAAFDLIVRKYQRRVMGLVSRRLGDPADARDVTQEVFLRAYRALPRFRGDSAFYTWLYRIAINTTTNYLAVQERHRTVSGSYAIDSAWEQEALQPGHFETPEQLLLSHEIGEKVKDAIDRLPALLKTALTLRELQGLTYEEIAQVSRCPIGTIRSRIFRAREAVKAELEPLLD
jgi:RNA polymerase sigma-70 factor (ECF subfamily)